jgi:iron transport multicopper oxidase
MSCEPNYVFSIDGHMLTVIEADGVLQNPVVVDSIQIHSGTYAFEYCYLSLTDNQKGQRYSFVLNANQERDNYCTRKLILATLCSCAHFSMS